MVTTPTPQPAASAAVVQVSASAPDSVIDAHPVSLGLAILGVFAIIALGFWKSIGKPGSA